MQDIKEPNIQKEEPKKKKENGILPITDTRMTRFNITLQQGVDFVLQCLDKMWGGELFVPKIPSYKILDIAKVIAPECKYEIVGIRAGEKLHEVMCPSDDSHLTLEFEDHFVIEPTINFFDNSFDYKTNQLGEKGENVDYGFEYNSGSNPVFLSPQEIIDYGA